MLHEALQETLQGTLQLTLEGAMKARHVFLGALMGLIATSPASAQTFPANEKALAIAAPSPLVKTSKAYITARIGEIRDATIRDATADAIGNVATCVAHRAGLDDAAKAKILADLKAAGLVDPEDDGKFPGGLLAGIFPPVKDEASACPHLPQAFDSAPGSVFGGHHSYPGGLAVHEALNLESDINLANLYRRHYGNTGANGMPEVMAAGTADPTAASAGVAIDQDVILAAPMWHDWGKTIVFQWNEDGSELPELNIGGNGKTDIFGGPGTSKTGAHHIIGVAETMKRGLPPILVIAQASAHEAPYGKNEALVANWLRAAAIIARIDPVAKGYLMKDAAGRDRLPPVKKLGQEVMLPTQGYILAEYVLHHLSDADYTFSGPAVVDADALLVALAPKFGVDPARKSDFNLKFRNPVLAWLSAERLQMIYAAGGLDAVATEIAKLRSAGTI
jgi:hypothetical protein